MDLTTGAAVLHLVGSFQDGGSERQALQLIRMLENSGRYRVLVACLNRYGPLDIARPDIPEFPLTAFYNWTMAVQLRRFARYLRRHRVHIVQTHDFYTNIFGMLGAAIAGVPVRIAARRETEGVRTRVQLRVEHIVYRLAQVIVTNSKAVRHRLILDTGMSPEKAVVIYNGLDMSRLTLGQEPHFTGIPAKRRFVTLVANLRYRVKDHPTFLRAARRVRAVVPDAAFLVAGEGALTGAMRRLAAELGLEHDVSFLGRCDRVADLLALSVVCVLSSKAEGFSNAILEYMAAARPVVATDVGGAREAVVEGETGYLVPPGDDAAMAARIISLLQDPERARVMGVKGQKRVMDNFSSTAQLRLTEELYDRLLSGVSY